MGTSPAIPPPCPGIQIKQREGAGAVQGDHSVNVRWAIGQEEAAEPLGLKAIDVPDDAFGGGRRRFSTP
jgi:hypothetical protein